MMKPELQRRVQRYGWDKASNYYEKYWQEQLAPAHRKLIGSINLTSGSAILDIACGSGQLTFPLAEMVGENGTVTGTDLSDEMVRLGNQKAKELGADNTLFVQMDSEDLRFEDGQFDAVICSLGLMYFPNPVNAIKEMFRVLKPGGTLGLIVWGSRKSCGWADVFEIVDSRVRSEVCPMFFQFGNKDILSTTLTLVGFREVECSRVNTLLRYNEDMDACVAVFAGGPVALAYNKFNDEVKNEVHLEYLDSIRKYKTVNGIEIPGEFLVCTAFKPGN